LSGPDPTTGAAASGAAPRLSLTAQILLGLALGVLLGLFFGERVRWLQPMADVYIRLMQMTVLPYLSVGLVLGFGRLDLPQAKLLAKYGLLTLAALWLPALAVVMLMPLAFPEYEAAFFFSTTLLEPRASLSFVDLYVPANPFHSLANSVVPAVTLFSAALGIAMIGVPGKERFLGPFDAFMQAIGRVTHFIVRLTPLGVIPIAAVAAGTLSPEELSRLEVYFVTFIAGAVVLGLVILPLMVTAVTPFGYREVVGTCRDALLTAFVTNNVFIVLPMIAERSEELARRHGLTGGNSASIGEVVVPIAFNFPTAGKLLTLLFVPFAAWLAGSQLEAAQYPGLMTAGVFSYFAKAQVALPFLMDLVEVPHDLFQLYIPTTLLNGKFDSMVGAMSLFAFALITATALAGGLRLDRRRLARFAVVSGVALGGTILVTRFALGMLVDTTYTKADALMHMHLSRSPPPMAVYRGQPPPVAAATLALDSMQRVLSSRILRVGYFEHRVPFSFHNAQGELVGFDVEMAAQMAQDLGVGLELIAVTPKSVDDMLDSGGVDIVASLPYTHQFVKRLRLSQPYMDATVGLLVLDARREEFQTVSDIQTHDELIFGVFGERDLGEDYARSFAGDTPYQIVVIDSFEQVLDPRGPSVDAIIVLAEAGMAWSLLHPQYSVVIPEPVLLRRPLAFGLARDSDELGQYVDEWVTLQKARGNVARAYDYWVLGKGADEREPRWSIARDVLGWLD
jgi:Na+/H+-dicarboxylate symporter/ABC-type amino acid transport substrate-binding protein